MKQEPWIAAPGSYDTRFSQSDFGFWEGDLLQASVHRPIAQCETEFACLISVQRKYIPCAILNTLRGTLTKPKQAPWFAIHSPSLIHLQIPDYSITWVMGILMKPRALGKVSQNF